MRSDVGSQRSDVGSQRSDVGSQRSDVGSQMSDVGGQMSEVGGLSEVRSQKMLVLGFSGRRRACEIQSRHSEPESSSPRLSSLPLSPRLPFTLSSNVPRPSETVPRPQIKNLKSPIRNENLLLAGQRPADD
jgi:hypothetical protein